MGRFLGQHFLRDFNIRDKIIAAAQLTPDDRVLEIGPGQGVITEQLLKHAKAVTAVELDSGLAQKLSSWPRLRLIEGDVLDLDLTTILRSDGSTETDPLPPRSWKVVEKRK